MQESYRYREIVDLEKSIIANRIKAIQCLRTSSSRDLSTVHVEILFLVFVKDRLTRQDLIQNIPNVSEATVKRYVAELIHDYVYVKEDLSENDNRKKYLSLSDCGAKLIQKEINNIKELVSLSKP